MLRCLIASVLVSFAYCGSALGQVQIDSFAPNQMSYLEGTPFTITGSGFTALGLTVTIGGVQATITSSTFTSIQGVSPSQLTPVSGLRAVTVDQFIGSSATLLDAVTLIAPFEVDDVPTTYLLADTSLQTITLTGNAFTPITDVEVFYDSEYWDPAQLTFNSPYSITAQLIPFPEGTYDLWVRGTPGSIDVAELFPQSLTFLPEASITSLLGGPVSYLGGPFTLIGEGFTPNTEVFVDGELADVSFLSHTQLDVSAPPRPGAFSGEDVTVLAIDPVTGKAFDSVVYWAEFSVTDLQPINVPADTATQVTITGTGFTNHTRVRVNEIPCAYSFIDHTTLDVTVPTLPAGVYPVRLFDSVPDVIFVEEEFSAGIVYYDAGPAVIDAVEPDDVCVTGGQAITVHGSGFIPDTTLFVGGAPLSRARVSRDGTRIHVTVPSGVAGPVDVTVSDFRGSDSSIDVLSYTDNCPTLLSPQQLEATVAYGTARFTWTNPEAYSEIHVIDPDGAVLAVLPGDATAYEAALAPGDNERELYFQGFTVVDTSAVVGILATLFECDYPPPLDGAVKPGPMNLAVRGGVSPADVVRCADGSGFSTLGAAVDISLMPGGGTGTVIHGPLADLIEASRLVTGFTLDQPAERLEISGYYEKVAVDFGISLRGRLVHVFPDDGFEDEFTFPEPLLGAVKTWHSITYYRADGDVGADPSASACLDGFGEPKLLPAGDYVLEIYAVGGEPGLPYFQFANDPRDTELLIQGTPCPPYPDVRVRDLSGIRTLPNVTDIKSQDAYELSSGKVRATLSARGTWIDEDGDVWAIDHFCDSISPVGAVPPGAAGPTTPWVCDDPPFKLSPFHEYCWTIYGTDPPSCVVNRGTTGAIAQMTFPDWGCYRIELTVSDIACGISRTFVNEVAITPDDPEDCNSLLYSFLYPTPNPSSIELVVGLKNPTPGFGEFEGTRPLDLRVLVAPNCFCTGLTPCVAAEIDDDPSSGPGDDFEFRLAVFDGTDYQEINAPINVFDLCPDVVVGAKYFQVTIADMSALPVSPYLVDYTFRPVYLQGRCLCFRTGPDDCFVPAVSPWFNVGSPLKMANRPTGLETSHWCGFFEEESGTYRFSVTPNGMGEVSQDLPNTGQIDFGIVDAEIPAFEGNSIAAGFTSRYETQGGMWLGSVGTGSSSGHLLENTLNGGAQALGATDVTTYLGSIPHDVYGWSQCETVFEQEFREELFRSIIWAGAIPPGIPLEIWGHVSLGMKYKVDSILETELSPFAPLPSGSHYELTYILDSNVEISVPCGISLDLVGGLASVDIRLVPTTEFHLQPSVVVDEFGVHPDYAVDTLFSMGMEIEACIQTIVLGEQCAPSIDIDLVPATSIMPGDPDFLSTGACSTSSAVAAAGPAFAGPGDTPAAGNARSLAITSPDGTTTMTLWIAQSDIGDHIAKIEILDVTDPSGEPFLLDATVPGISFGFLFIEPSAAFIDNETILLAGLSRPNGFAPQDPPDDVDDPDFFDIRNDNVVYTEIRLGKIVKTSPGSWSVDLETLPDASDPTGTPTEQRRADGRPHVAGRGATGEASVAWVRYEDDYLILDGDTFVHMPNIGTCGLTYCGSPSQVPNIRPQLERTSIAVRRLDVDGPLPGDPITTISELGINVQPAMTYSPDGTLAYCVWVHDPTHTDLIAVNTGRFLKAAIYDVASDSWTAPFDVVAVPDDYPGILQPSVALSSNDDGIVAFTALIDTADPDDAGLNGGSRRVFTARLLDGVFDEPVELRGVCGEAIYGWGLGTAYVPHEQFAPSPESQLLTPEIYMSWQEFGIPGTQSGSGNVMLSCLERGASTWSAPMRLLPAGDAVISNVSMTVANGQLTTMYLDSGPAAGVSALAGPTVTGYKSLTVPLEPDLAIARCELSSAFPAPGSMVGGTVTLENRGLTSTPIDMLGQSQTGLEVVLIDDLGGETVVQSIPLDLLAPGARDRVGFVVEMPHDPVRLEVRLAPNPIDRDRTNDFRECLFGAPSPTNFSCESEEAPGTVGSTEQLVRLKWTNPVVYDRIELYRDGVILHTLPGRISTFVDSGLSSLPQSYDIRGLIGASRSRKTALICDTAGSSFVRGDANGDGQVNIADAIFSLDYLFVAGTEPPCFAAADVNVDGQVNIADTINLLGYLFQAGSPPAAPFPDCGASTVESDEALGCAAEGC